MRYDGELWAALDAWDPDDDLPDALIRAIERDQAIEESRALDALAHRCGQRLFLSLSMVMGLLACLAVPLSSS